MARKRRPDTGKSSGQSLEGWRLLPRAESPQKEPAAVSRAPENLETTAADDAGETLLDDADIAAFLKSNPELLQEAFAALGEFRTEFVKANRREPTEQDLLDHLGLGDDLDGDSFTDLLDGIRDDDLDPFPPTSTEKPDSEDAGDRPER